jgi:two-component system, cell cycle sensor histidine kinase and response regulator CckA
VPDEGPVRAADAEGGSAPPAILLADSGGGCTHVNHRWTEITRSESSQNLGEGWIEFFHPEDRESVRSAWTRCVGTRGDLSLVVRTAGNGPPRRLHLRATPISAEAGGAAGFAVTLEEAIEPARHEAELLHARKMETVGRLATGLAHDFANLLTMISGYTEIVLSRLGANDELRPEVDEIRKAASCGAALTRQLLTFSRRHAVEPQVLDLNALVADMQKMLRRIIGEHIDLSTHLGADLGSVKADPGQIEQVIMNLAINSRDAMPRGGRISIRTANVYLDSTHDRVRMGLDPGAYVLLQFHDTGHGMDGETMRQVFEPFFTTKDKGKGTGLGLAAVYDIVKLCRGDVRVQSEPGKGTAFTIYLPCVETKGQPAAPEAAARSTRPGTETILLVEDEDGVRRLLRFVLSQHGYTVLEAGNGPEALARFQQHGQPVHLLLTDIVMPRMGGRELADRLLKLQPDLKVIYMSGYTDEALVGIGGLAGALFLQKPLRPDVLAASVREALEGAVTPREATKCVRSGM